MRLKYDNDDLIAIFRVYASVFSKPYTPLNAYCVSLSESSTI